MENVTSIAAKQPGIAFPSLRCIPKMAARRLISGAENRGIRVSAGCIRAQQVSQSVTFFELLQFYEVKVPQW